MTLCRQLAWHETKEWTHEGRVTTCPFCGRDEDIDCGCALETERMVTEGARIFWGKTPERRAVRDMHRAAYLDRLGPVREGT